MRHHGAGLRRLEHDHALVEAVERDYTEAALAREDRAMLDYAAKLTRTPGAMVEDDVLFLADLLEPVVNHNVAVREWQDEVIFLYHIAAGRTRSAI